MDMSQAPIGHDLAVVWVDTGRPSLDRRLQELGLRPGAPVSLLRRTSGRAAIVAIGDDRLALSRTLLRAVTVTTEVQTGPR